MNAIHNGIDVSASEKLWIVSARSATEPVTRTITTCASAVAMRATSEIFTARIPRAELSRAESIESAASWLCGW